MENCSRVLWVAVFIFFIATGCADNEGGSYVVSDFESGSIGEVYKISDTGWELSLADDNDNMELPDRWRNWWYVRMDSVSVEAPVVIHLKNRGWPYYYLPVYSYDQKTWHRFSEDEVYQPGEYELRMEKQFEASTVWIARFYPYTYSDLIAYLATKAGRPHVMVDIPGETQEGNPIYLLTLTHNGVPDSDKKRVWIHARTHPAETGPSFVLEGLIDFLLSGTWEAETLLSQFIFHIVPMQNVDGVIAGNYRATPASENLEVMWYSDPDDPLQLTDDAPVEVSVLHRIITGLMDEDPGFSIALNLHASNSEPDIRPFFYPHFGPAALGYTQTEASLWDKQIRFMNSMGFHYGEAMLEPVPAEGGSSFAEKTYPESWWWKNFQDDVMAITMETTYGRAGYAPDWITPEDLRYLGGMMALALGDYADESILFGNTDNKALRDHQKSMLKYPELYPPDAMDEMKE